MHNLLIIAGLLGGLGTGEIIIIALVVLLLFGGSKIPELMKGVGKGVKGFKDGLKGLEDDINDSGKKEADKNTPNADVSGKDKTSNG